MSAWLVAMMATTALAQPPNAPEVELGVVARDGPTAKDDDVASVDLDRVDAEPAPDDSTHAPDDSTQAGDTTQAVGPVADWSGYHGTGLRTVRDIQPYAVSSTLDLSQTDGPWSAATLVDLQPAVGDWYLLELVGDDTTATYHVHSRGWHVTVDPADPEALWLTSTEPPPADDPDASPERVRCALFSERASKAIVGHAEARLGYAPLCQGRVYLRHPLEGRKTTIEWASDLLRDNLWGGEELTVFVRDTFFKDKYLTRGELDEGDEELTAQAGPPTVRLTEAGLRGTLTPENLGLPVPEGPLRAGHWVELVDQPGMFATVLQPQLAHPDVVAALGDGVRGLQAEERDALVYLVAFDLDQFAFDYELGTDHPRLDWSDRPPAASLDPSIPGPDGFDTAAPLARTGQVPPWARDQLVATFTAGFKRSHGAFPIGRLSRENHGHHYGFLSHGVVLSTLQPDLSTLTIDVDGRVDLHTWSPDDEARMHTLRHARQNGVPIVHRDADTGEVVAGDLVTSWSGGNWASSVDGNLRSLRAGLCLIEDDGERYLVYGYFTGATPSAMAVVFKAAGCSYGMMADMNALEHTYMATYSRSEGDGEGGGDRIEWTAHHLDTGMAVLDEEGRNGEVQPRFVAFPDNRDFFYVVRR